MRCSVVFGVPSRLVVINITSTSPTINTGAYYQRLLLARRWPSSTGDFVDNSWHVAALTAGEIGSESRFLPTPPAFDAPRYGGSRRNIAIPFGTGKLE